MPMYSVTPVPGTTPFPGQCLGLGFVRILPPITFFNLWMPVAPYASSGDRSVVAANSANLQHSSSRSNLSRTIDGSRSHLTGLRGAASLIVFNWHILLPFYTPILRPYSTSQPSSFLQLPFLRFFVVGFPLVQLFACLSGYVQSLKPLKTTSIKDRGQQPQPQEPYLNLARRAVRILLSCIPVTALSLIAVRWDLFRFADLAPDAPFFHQLLFPSRKPDVASQIGDWYTFNVSLANIFFIRPFQPGTNYGPHLWTIPLDLRCSLMLAVTLSMISRLSNPGGQLYVLALFLGASATIRSDLYKDVLASTFIGCLLAHITTFPRFSIYQRVIKGIQRWSSYLTILSIYLTSLPVVGSFSPQTAGSHPLLYSTSRLSAFYGINLLTSVLIIAPPAAVRRLLNAEFFQNLGKISFSFYLLHNPIIQLLGYPTVKYLKNDLGWGTLWAVSATGAVLFPVTVQLATWYNRFVEEPIRAWASTLFRGRAGA